MKNLAIIVFLLSGAFHLHSQTITWEKQFHFDVNNEVGAAIEEEDSGYFVVTWPGGRYVSLSLFTIYHSLLIPWLVCFLKSLRMCDKFPPGCAEAIMCKWFGIRTYPCNKRPLYCLQNWRLSGIMSL